MGWKEEEKIMEFVNQLRGEAVEVFNSLTTRQQFKWKAIKTELQYNIPTPAESPDENMIKLENAWQEQKETLRWFSTRITRYARRAFVDIGNQEDDEHKKKHFLRELLVDNIHSTLSRSDMTFDKMAKEARKMETELRRRYPKGLEKLYRRMEFQPTRRVMTAGMGGMMELPPLGQTEEVEVEKGRQEIIPEGMIQEPIDEGLAEAGQNPQGLDCPAKTWVR